MDSMDSKDIKRIDAYTDGASLGNPGRGGWGVVLLDSQRVVELGGRASNVTNNQMELQAALSALQYVFEHWAGVPEFRVLTDSAYVVNGMTRWIRNWQGNGWKTTEGKSVVNRELWEALFIAANRDLVRTKMIWSHVAGHAGIAGNERADQIASGSAKDEPVNLFDGSQGDYEDYYSIKYDAVIPKIKGGRKNRKAYSYLSLVNGVPMRHSTWNECEARVSGRPNVRFKKAMSEEEEGEILRAWGVNSNLK